MVDKLSKALEGLKNIQFATAIEDTAIRKKEKMLTCAVVADLMVSLKLTNAQNLPQLLGIVIESLIHLCDDKDSDVRIVADESLNRIIRFLQALSESNMLKVQVELHKEIKKNGPARCLRAALWRFGQLSCFIRPNKGKGHVGNLIPCIIEICKREEENVHETLASFIEDTFKVIGVFIQDSDIKALLKAFFNNLSCVNVVIRRTTAACIKSTVKYCRKPHVFNSYVLNTLLDCLVPVNEETSSCLVLGVLGCLRILLPNLGCDRSDEGISGSFGLRQKKDESLLSVDRLIQTYELCLHYSKSKDHNIVTASLETLNQLLQNSSHQIESLLLMPSGFGRSYINSTKENIIKSRSGSETSVACSISGGEETFLLDEAVAVSIFDFRPLSAASFTEDTPGKDPIPKGSGESSDDEIKMIDNPFKEKLLGEILEDQLRIGVDSDGESLTISETNVSSFLIGNEGSLMDGRESSGFKEISKSATGEDLSSSHAEDESFGSEMDVDVGAFTDNDIPLNYCARHLAANFLLGGNKNSLRSDRSVRVSIKSLALTCISAIIRLHPRVLRMSLAKNNKEVYNQEMKDILLLTNHTDPQIRGNVCLLATNFIQSVLLESKGYRCDWIKEEDDILNISNLLDIVLKGLKDESTTCSRQVLSGLKTALKTLLFSVEPEKVLPVLNYLPSLANSSYWLLKVKLIGLFGELPYICINELTCSNYYQEEIMETVFFPFLRDEDSRVRTAAAESLAKVIPRLYYGNSTLLAYSREFTAQMKTCLNSKKGKAISGHRSRPFPPFCYASEDDADSDFDLGIEGSLCRIVAKLTNSLMVAVDKYYIFGCLEALKLLSEKYPPTVYVDSWNCSNVKTDFPDSELASNLINIILSLVVISPVVSDLSALTNATTVLGNLFAGYCICNMKKNYQVALASPSEEPTKLWSTLKNEELSDLAEHIFTHVMKVLNIYSHLLEEITINKAGPSASATSALLPVFLASPIKRQEKKGEKEMKSEERKQKCPSYKQSPQYNKLYQLLKRAYNNYKVSLDISVSEKFVSLLESTIDVLCILLEVGTVHDTGRCAEEILSYLRPAISLCANRSVLCGIQLLKSLFGTNLGSNWEEKKSNEFDNVDSTLFTNMYQSPLEFLLSRINNHSISTTLECENLVGSRRRVDRKVPNADKNCLATYIRLFEPMLIKSSQLYTITNDVILQSNVLKLLNHVIQLRVNYCLLDADEIFVGFVLKQFELIEHGQIPGVEKLLPELFKFLVLLSYERHHSKTIISVPKILQLCDGLMASNQPTQTHCIPALFPIVDYVFSSRNIISLSGPQKELETQREVVLAMLLRLVEFHEVMNMLAWILNEVRTLEERERWKRWSRQIIDAILPLASQDKLRTESFEGQESFDTLMSSLSPNVLRPIDPLLKILFVEPNDFNCSLSLKRWLSRVTVIIGTVLHVKEDVLLCRLEEISPNLDLGTFLPPRNIQSDDPFNVKYVFPKFESSETFARFLLKIIAIMGYKILESISTSYHFQRQLSIFFLCVFHILKSGTFHRISHSLQVLLNTEQDLMSKICLIFIKMLNFAPELSCQFTHFLALLNYFDKNYWTRILSETSTLSSKLVRHCGVISLSDYLCEILSDTDTLKFLLSTSLKEMILLSNEGPVKELITTIHGRAESVFLMEAIGSNADDSNNIAYVEKLLRILEIAHNAQSGFILSLLVRKFITSPYLALSRLASLLACRRTEYLLTLSPDEVRQCLNKDQFHELIALVDDKKLIKRNSTLAGLLNKLCIQVYDIPTLEITPADFVRAQELKVVKLDETWYATQVKERCCQENYNGHEIAGLLSTLNYDSIIEIMSSKKFNVEILKDCLLFLNRTRCHVIKNETAACDPLSKATKTFILLTVSDFIKKLDLSVSGGKDNGCDNVEDLAHKVLRDEILHRWLWKFAPCVTILMDVIQYEKVEMEDDSVEYVMKFGVILLKILNCLSEKESISGNDKKGVINPEKLEIGLACGINILRNGQISRLLSQKSEKAKLKSCIENVYFLVKYLIPESSNRMSFTPESRILLDKSYAYDELRLMDVLLTLAIKGSLESLLPSHVTNIIGELIKCLCCIPEICMHILKVPESCDIQEIETLENFILTFSTINWTCRQQFEEIWVGLLAVLGFNSQANVSIEENTLVVQAITAAVEGMTTLLKNTMINPVTRKILHHGRDCSAMKISIDELPLVGNIDAKNQFGDKSYHFLDNLEISKLSNRYHHGLLSVEYIWTAVKQINSGIESYKNHVDYIDSIGLDLTSCVHLLMELYNQWIFQPAPDIRLITCCLKSSIVISDLFTDTAQFQWLLDFCLHIENVVIAENVIILPLIIVGCCKAVSVVLPDLEMCDRVKRLMLHSRSIPCRIAAIQGLLYLLQCPVATSFTSQPQKRRNLSKSGVNNYVTNIVDMFLPVAIDIVQQFKHDNVPANEEYERCFWSLVFYLVQHYQFHLQELRKEMLHFILMEMNKKPYSDSVLTLLVRGIERLLLTSVTDESFKDQICKIALDMTSQSSIIVSRCGLQLLMVLSFLEKRAKDIRVLVTGIEDPEKIMKDMEKINVLFEKMKRSYPEEAEIVGDVISYIIVDFTASDILSKVIQEFLSPHQPHLKILAGLLFKVFERAELRLLEDWVVFSLPSFIQGLPVGMSMWTLNCFFVSASNETWLRSMFPLVQSRLRMAEPEDRDMLCLSASHFYKQLKDEKQKKLFVETFENAVATHSIFSDLLASL